MKRIGFVLALFVVFSAIGCASINTAYQDHQVAVNSMATNVGYVSARALSSTPANAVINSICTINTIQDPVAMQKALVDSLKKIWVAADKLNTKDAQMAIMAINNMVGYVGLQTDVQQTKTMVSEIVSSFCAGVKLAE